MTPSEYQTLALRTENKSYEIPALRLFHGVIGIGTEVAELVDSQSVENALQEIGDVLWYVALLCDVLNTCIADIDWGGLPVKDDLLDGMVICMGKIQDYTKRHVFYGVELDKYNMLASIGCLYKHLHEYADEHNLTIEDAMELNIEKLKKRYPDKFCPDKAVNRNTKAEEDIFDEFI